MTIDALVQNLHSSITSTLPKPSKMTTEEEAEAIFMHGDPMTGSFEPAPLSAVTIPSEGEAPRSIAEGAVRAVAQGDDLPTALGPYSEAVAGEAVDAGWITHRCTTTETSVLVHNDYELTPAGRLLASERGWLNEKETPMTDDLKKSDFTENITNASAPAARRWINENVADYDHVEEARRVENFRPRPRSSVLALLDRIETEMRAEDAELGPVPPFTATNPGGAEEGPVVEALPDVVAAVEAVVVPEPAPATRTLAEVKQQAENVLSMADEGTDSTLVELCRAILSVADKPARKAKASTPKAPKVATPGTFGTAKPFTWVKTSRGVHRFVLGATRFIWQGGDGNWKRGSVKATAACSEAVEPPSPEAHKIVLSLLTDAERVAFEAAPVAA